MASHEALVHGGRRSERRIMVVIGCIVVCDGACLVSRWRLVNSLATSHWHVLGVTIYNLDIFSTSPSPSSQVPRCTGFKATCIPIYRGRGTVLPLRDVRLFNHGRNYQVTDHVYRQLIVQGLDPSYCFGRIPVVYELELSYPLLST